MNKLLLALLASISIAGLTACGGGGSSSSSSTAAPAVSSSTAYQAGVTVGDDGLLCLNTNSVAVAETAACPALAALSYSLKIQNSSYGLAGQIISGAITANVDGSYKIAGTTNGTLFVYPSYALMVMKLDPANPIYANYFAKNPFITKAIYVPIFALVKSNLLSTVDAITSNGASLEFRSASMGRTAVGSSTPTYSSEASRGTITKISNASFSVASCSNNGSSAQNSNLKSANCTGGLVSTKIYTYDPTSGGWLVSPKDAPDQLVRAYFVTDVMENSVVGYIDTSDSSMNTSKFAITAVVPANTSQPLFGSSPSAFTSYEACSSDDNCAGDPVNGFGIDINPSVTIQNTGTLMRSNYMTDGPCDYNVRPNGVVNGFMDAVYTGGPGACTNSGDRPDNMMFFFGSRTTSNNKVVTLTVMVGYDPTVVAPRPSQKISIGYIAQN